MRQWAAADLTAVLAIGGGTFALLDQGHAPRFRPLRPYAICEPTTETRSSFSNSTLWMCLTTARPAPRIRVLRSLFTLKMGWQALLLGPASCIYS